MDSLKDITSENIRKNWTEHKEELYNSPYYEVLWQCLENKFKIDTDNVYYVLFKKFINNEDIDYSQPLNNRINIEKLNDTTIILGGLTSRERSQIHVLCDKVGLHHESKTKKKLRYLHISKPKIWLWEFTEGNPASKRYELQKQQKNERLSQTRCDTCNKSALETELFISVYVGGIYCEECLETTSDGAGGMMGDHKFEPI
jgi:hypothetical protein